MPQGGMVEGAPRWLQLANAMAHSAIPKALETVLIRRRAGGRYEVMFKA
jgi:hypothetical protein